MASSLLCTRVLCRQRALLCTKFASFVRKPQITPAFRVLSTNVQNYQSIRTPKRFQSTEAATAQVELESDSDHSQSDTEQQPPLCGVQWSRFSALNQLLPQGHLPGQLTIITGPVNSGKTVFASEYALDLCEQGMPTAWCSFGANYLNMEKVMIDQMIGNHFYQRNKGGKLSKAFSRLSTLPLYFMDLNMDVDFLNVTQKAILTEGLQHVIIDNVDRISKSQRNVALFALRQFALNHKCHVTVVISESQCPLLSKKLTYEADYTLNIVDKYTPRFKCDKYVEVFDGEESILGVIPLYFDKQTSCFSLYHQK